MDLPENVEHQIVDYLNLEYGIYQEDKKIRVGDLTFDGEKKIDGKEVRYWKFPCSEKSGCWATVEEYEGSILISMTTKSPS
ncbi:MAG: hypothetical protein K6L76_02985 [Agarilytica sp.]